MTRRSFDDETLMAFADGELDEAQSLALEEALAGDEALAERLAVFMDSRQLVGDALKPLIDEPVPEALRASVRQMVEEAQRQTISQDKVVSFRPKHRQPVVQPTVRPWLMPVAASLVAVVTGVIGFSFGRMVPSAPNEGAEIAAALDREASGRDVTLAASRGVLHVVASFRDERGELCREYELKQPESSTLNVACRQNGTWTTRLALTTSQTDGYVPASSQETIDAYLSSIEAGAPLSPEEERAILAP
ncbi:anti-sigma factor family protein [Rhizobium nepotum]|uniref:anti-sigma factor family protein n=1 Tax=Rhizobium nepotum TaxID=1035271 RepID=UPI003CEE419E